VRDSGADAARALFRAGEQRARDQAGWARLLIEFRLVAARDPELNRRYAETHEFTVTRLAAALEQAVDPWRSPLTPRLVAQLTLAVASGLTLERAADPTALPTEDIDICHRCDPDREHPGACGVGCLPEGVPAGAARPVSRPRSAAELES
jgi:hypothetical protein